jgi:hypothetical protein
LGRVPRLSQHFVNDCHALAPTGFPAARDVSRVVRALLSAESLPAPDDTRALLALPGSQVQVFCYGRRVPGRGLWVWYRPTLSEVKLEALTAS